MEPELADVLPPAHFTFIDQQKKLLSAVIDLLFSKLAERAAVAKPAPHPHDSGQVVQDKNVQIAALLEVAEFRKVSITVEVAGVKKSITGLPDGLT